MRVGIGGACLICLFAACAGTRAEAPARIAELEARVAQLEHLLAPEAGAAEPDGGIVVVSSEAGAMPGTPTGAVPVVARDAGFTHSDALAACIASAEGSCRLRSAELRVEPPIGDAGFAWTQLKVPESVASSPAGRKCMTLARASCMRQVDADGQDAALRAWLDAQLTPDRIDRAFSEKVRQVLDENRPRFGAAEVLCTARFCRVSDPSDAGAGSASFAVHASEQRSSPSRSQSRRFNAASYEYITRHGYQFPN